MVTDLAMLDASDLAEGVVILAWLLSVSLS